ncbi:hypothetical protein JCM3263A_12090 [Thermobifida fusca]|jgi:hypothetical protein|uniref:DUF397 domain-containing protein n=2 Tax=Thermobifida fusca TaxID=2021 RepID=A0A9P2WRW1_THEFU|nr:MULTISPECIES: DUF397 domain-containing protein [Thermobifida]AAZ54746.1 conserved hypothetical protein [Thermobifida fusca YX]EOR72256.1 hypothetical protein TM51_03892 [Thermobifida fusca TM51]MBO2529397.1 DUF397 domain-containing protein [Thermobifida sp.]MDD6791848.1 DUF397 domain-containing protein [Thermobifida fusca]PPS96481.1 regulator [Thermobifida fusca]
MNTAGKTLEWRKSSYSGRDYNCVEVADLPGATAVRDSKNPDAAVLAFPTAEWVAFLQAARSKHL